jgi:hypothetical protein
MMTSFIQTAKARWVASVCGLALVATLAVAVSLSFGVSSALGGNGSNCPSISWCIYSGTNLDGTVWGFDQADHGTSWFNLNVQAGMVASSLYNNRQHSTFFSHDYQIIPPPPSTQDCQIPGGERLNLSNSGNTYPDGNAEWHNIFEAELTASVTTC